MAGTTITIAEINTKMNLAITSLEAGDYAAAETYAIAAEAMIAVKPDTTFSDEELSFDREAIGRFIERMAKKARSARTSSAITQIPVRQKCSYLGSTDCT